MIWWLLACAISPEVEQDSSSPFCVELNSNGAILLCNNTGEPAYSCVWQKSCWYDAGGETWAYVCAYADDQRRAEDELSAWCGGWTAQ